MFWGTKYVINKNLKHCQTNVCIPILNKNDVYFYLELYVLTCTFVLDYSYVEEFSIMKYYHRIGWIFSKLHLHPYHLLKTTFSIMSLCLKLNHCLIDWLIDWLIVFNANRSSISAISWHVKSLLIYSQFLPTKSSKNNKRTKYQFIVTFILSYFIHSICFISDLWRQW
jgi:hypothetical protein